MIHPFRFIDITVRRPVKKVVSRDRRRVAPPIAARRSPDRIIEALRRAICRARNFIVPTREDSRGLIGVNSTRQLTLRRLHNGLHGLYRARASASMRKCAFTRGVT